MPAQSPLVLLYFYTEWAEPCKLMGDLVSAIEQKFPEIQVRRINAENDGEENQLAVQYQVQSVPTVVFTRYTKEVGRVDGLDVQLLTDTVLHLTETTDADNGREKNHQEYLRGLINKHTFMIFIKGSPQQPRCGFTAQLIRLLNEHKIDFDYFDILADERVRQDLKAYSNWPTYPQIYLRGELIGGLDIFQDIIQSGQLQSLMTPN